MAMSLPSGNLECRMELQRLTWELRPGQSLLDSKRHQFRLVGTAQPNSTPEKHTLAVGILAPPDQHLLPLEVGLLVDHEEAALHPAGVAPAQIILFEERNFQGRSYECSSDCSDIHLHMSRCSSCRVENGCFVLYDRSNFGGNQVFLKKGEYSDLARVGSVTGVGAAALDTVRSCRLIPTHRGQFKLKIYELENFGGQMQELLEDCESLQDRLYMSDCQSCAVLEGHWLLFEQPNYRGRVIYVRPGEHRSLRESGPSGVSKISSVRRIVDVC